MTDSSDVHKPSKPEKRLCEAFPEEVAFFRKVFLWAGCKSGCYVRYAYEAQVIDGLQMQKWSPIKTRGRWQSLYSELVDSLVEKHLDFERFCRTRPDKDRLTPRVDETAFWVGTMAGTTTRTHAIDLDAHDYIGWYSVPSRWHTDRTGWVNGPYSYRDLPVIRPDMQFFMTAKLIHEHFPNRIWAFSSGNLGLSAWSIYHREVPVQMLFRKAASHLASAGLAHLEHYPCPAKTAGSLGRCHRRPCGADSGIITPTGVITDPIEQIRCIMNPQGTPTFNQILDAYWKALEQMYCRFLSCGESLDHKKMPVEVRRSLVDECWKIVDEVKKWAVSGCPFDRTVLKGGSPRSSSTELVTHILNSTDRVVWFAEEEEEMRSPDVTDVPASSSHPQIFETVDLLAINKAGLWIQFVKFLVEQGLPCEDKFFEVISTLTKWFAFVEWHGRPTENIKALLRQYVLQKNNGKVSRLLNGQIQDVLDHVDRIVEAVLNNSEAQVRDVFSELRSRRTEGYYRQTVHFAPDILRTELVSPLSCVSSNICNEAQRSVDHANWEYVPDDNPLDDFVLERVRAAFKKQNKQLRRGKDGRFPTLDSITRFFNYLKGGRVPGQRRASQQLLIRMGFPSSGRKRSAIINVLVREGILQKGGYLALEASRLWTFVTPTSNTQLKSGEYCHEEQ